MNCQECENLLAGARGASALSAAAQEATATHLEACALCAARARTMTQLDGALATLREDDNHTAAVGAPAHLESALVVAFRAQYAARPAIFAVAAMSSAPRAAVNKAERTVRHAAVKAHTLPRFRRLYGGAGVLVLASLALLIAVDLMRYQLHPIVSSTAGAGTSRPGHTDTNLVAAPTVTGSVPVSAAHHTEQLAQSTAHEVEPRLRNAKLELSSRLARFVSAADRARRAVLPTVREVAGGEYGSLTVVASAITAAGEPSEGETTTEFLSLNNSGANPPLESGRVVRVQLPGAALANLGLSVNAATDGELIKADVLLADDGTARAIRFVR